MRPSALLTELIASLSKLSDLSIEISQLVGGSIDLFDSQYPETLRLLSCSVFEVVDILLSQLLWDLAWMDTSNRVP